ncbi:MAG TPA: regulatory protein RecX [Longimicrobiaceae bacterium]|nr:regulatory protein RecX [Longimicrobiaceae bacterium]
MMQITALEQDPADAERIRLHVDGAFRLALPAEVVLAERLRSGDRVSEERLAELERRDQAWRAREAALVLLAYRARSAEELRRRLERKGFAPEIARACVDGLGELGMVDDAAFAETFVRDRIRLRPHGRRRLSRELRAKGVDEETATAALDEVMEREEVSDADLAREAAARWHPRAGEDDARARRRLYGFLARRGFGADAIRQVIEEKLG